jgi:tetratricopeptide (TPR) repeat protein
LGGKDSGWRRSGGNRTVSRESYTSIRATRWPHACGATPRRVVSTSARFDRRAFGAVRFVSGSAAPEEHRLQAVEYGLISGIQPLAQFRHSPAARRRRHHEIHMIRRFPLRAAVAALAFASAASLHAEDAVTAPPPEASVVPAPHDAPLTADLFYRLILGDVALQRGDLGIAARAYLEAARATKDSRLAARATEVAIAARQRMLVHDSAALWSELDPEAERPKNVLAALASNDNKGAIPNTAANDELRARIERVLSEAALSGPGVGDVFMQLPALFSSQSDKRAVLSLIRDVAKPYPRTPEAHYAVAVAAFTAAKSDPALAKEARDEIDEALSLRPDWARAAILKAEIVGRDAPDEADAGLEAFVDAHPEAKSAAGALAQRYVDGGQFSKARAVMQRLWDREPQSRDLEFGVATIALQMKDYGEAGRLFDDLKRAKYGEPGVVDLYLAQIAEETRHYAKAIEHYQAVTEGDRAWLAKLRIGAMYGKLGQRAKAQQWLAGLSPVTREQTIQRMQAQAQLMRDAGDDAGAYRLLAKSLAEHPDTPDLIYDFAMVAEKLDKVDEAEAKLKHLVSLRPEDAQALNALGYTLVDRTSRTDEGLSFIRRAHDISPDDPFILDSLGWAYYRLGRFDEAARYLQQALAGRPDAEIAAHLGEVLWRRGDHDKAREVWKTQLDAHPDNRVLKETMQRFEP